MGQLFSGYTLVGEHPVRAGLVGIHVLYAVAHLGSLHLMMLRRS